MTRESLLPRASARAKNKADLAHLQSYHYIPHLLTCIFARCAQRPRPATDTAQQRTLRVSQAQEAGVVYYRKGENKRRNVVKEGSVAPSGAPGLPQVEGKRPHAQVARQDLLAVHRGKNVCSVSGWRRVILPCECIPCFRRKRLRRRERHCFLCRDAENNTPSLQLIRARRLPTSTMTADPSVCSPGR